MKDCYISAWSGRFFKFVVFILIAGMSSSAWAVIEQDDFEHNWKWTGNYAGMLERREI